MTARYDWITLAGYAAILLAALALVALLLA